MAFKPLPESKRGRAVQPTNDVCVAAFKVGPKNFNTVLSIPRTVLRDAGLPDYPGATFDILVGEGADFGSVAIIDGPRFKAHKVGSSSTPHRLAIRSALLSNERRTTTRVRFEVGRKQIIVHMPADFAWRPECLPAPAPELGVAA